ncbi:pyridoxal-phosphate dependent enzyme [Jatrophihabitans sp.]|uniref:pyridoxal-phosphate dependent enzyme n=1 Tax=Jatrophihabitans sp. TaxID=1932789 RepID=UPI002EF25F1C
MTALHSSIWTAAASPRNWHAPAPGDSPVEFHRALPGYQPTPLVEVWDLAAELAVERVLVKDESNRFGLPAFKILGASWAVERALSDGDGGVTALVAATDGNHGRAVARLAAQRGLAARIFVPTGVHPAAVAAIEAEGATVTTVGDAYDSAVAAAVADVEGNGGLLVQDTAWPGYEQLPAWIVEGYTTMFVEIDEQLGDTALDLLVVPVGVGSLAQAAVGHYRRPGIRHPPALLSVEPERAACLLRSLQRDEPVTVATSPTIMTGLCCETPSVAAWPYLRQGLDAAVAVQDSEALAAAADLAAAGVPSGPCGAATLAAARRALGNPEHRDAELREHLGITATSTVVLLSTESRTANPHGGTS